MIILTSRKDATDLMKKVGLVKDDYLGERGRTYFKLPHEDIVCQSTITKVGPKFYVSFFGEHAKIAQSIGIEGI